MSKKVIFISIVFIGISKFRDEQSRGTRDCSSEDKIIVSGRTICIIHMYKYENPLTEKRHVEALFSGIWSLL